MKTDETPLYRQLRINYRNLFWFGGLYGCVIGAILYIIYTIIGDWTIMGAFLALAILILYYLGNRLGLRYAKQSHPHMHKDQEAISSERNAELLRSKQTQIRDLLFKLRDAYEELSNYNEEYKHIQQMVAEAARNVDESLK